MPRYNFLCQNEDCEKSGKVVEVSMSMDDAREGVTPVCSVCEQPMKRKFHTLSVNMKQPLGSKGEIYTDLQSAEDQLYSMITESEN